MVNNALPAQKLTIMVNPPNPYLKILPDVCQPPSRTDSDGSDRKIGEEALWDLQELVKIASLDDAETVKMVTSKAERDYENLVENGFDLNDVLAELAVKGVFKGSWWCKTSASKDRYGKPRGVGSWIPCDAYSVTLDYEHPKTGYRGTANYYLKMCKSLDGSLVLFVSVHL